MSAAKAIVERSEYRLAPGPTKVVYQIGSISFVSGSLLEAGWLR